MHHSSTEGEVSGRVRGGRDPNPLRSSFAHEAHSHMVVWPTCEVVNPRRTHVGFFFPTWLHPRTTGPEETSSIHTRRSLT